MDNMHNENDMKYVDRYNKEKYANISIRIKPESKQEIVNYAKNRNLSIASFIVKSCKYIIDNNIQLK